MKTKLMLSFMLAFFLALSLVSAVHVSDKIVNYYKLDEPSGAVIDSVGNFNGTNVGAIANVTGFVGSAYNFTGGYIDIGHVGNFSSDPFTISFWYYNDGYTDYEAFFGGGLASGTGCKAIYVQPNAGNRRLTLGKRGSFERISTYQVLTADWEWVAIVLNDSGVHFYVNGNFSDYVTSADTYETCHLNHYLGAGSGVVYSGILDEVLFSNETFDSDEIQYIYQEYLAGRSYPFIDLPTIELIDPLNNLHINTVQNFTANFTSTVGLDTATLSIYNSTDDLIFTDYLLLSGNESVVGIEADLSSYGDGTYTWNYIVNDTEGASPDPESRTIIFDSNTPLMNWFLPSENITVYESNYTLNVTIQDTYLDAVNVSVFNGTDYVYTNFSGNLTQGFFSVDDPLNFSEYGEYQVEVCARDSFAESPKIRDLTYLAKSFSDEDEYFDYALNNVLVRRTSYIINNGGQKVARQDFNLDIVDSWLDDEHLKTDINFDKLLNSQWGIRIDYECLQGCEYIEVLDDRGKVRVTDNTRTVLWKYDDAILEGWNVNYIEGEGIVSVVISYPSQQFYNSRPEADTIDPIFQGLNTNCESYTISYEEIVVPESPYQFTGEIIAQSDPSGIYALMRTIGAGLYLLFSFLVASLPVLLLGLVLVGILVVIGLALKSIFNFKFIR